MSAPVRTQLALAWSATDEVPSMLKVAFATSDRTTVNQHFGASVGFAIHAIDAGARARLVEVAEFPDDAADNNEHRLADKISALDRLRCGVLPGGGRFGSAPVAGSQAQPIRLDDEKSIETLLVDLRCSVRDGGVVWIDRALKKNPDEQRFDRMVEEGWQENAMSGMSAPVDRSGIRRSARNMA